MALEIWNCNILETKFNLWCALTTCAEKVNMTFNRQNAVVSQNIKDKMSIFSIFVVILYSNITTDDFFRCRVRADFEQKNNVAFHNHTGSFGSKLILLLKHTGIKEFFVGMLSNVQLWLFYLNFWYQIKVSLKVLEFVLEKYFSPFWSQVCTANFKLLFVGITVWKVTFHLENCNWHWNIVCWDTIGTD